MLDYGSQRSALAVDTRRLPRRCRVVRCRVDLYRCRIGLVRNFRPYLAAPQHRGERKQENDRPRTSAPAVRRSRSPAVPPLQPASDTISSRLPGAARGHTAVFTRTLSTLDLSFGRAWYAPDNRAMTDRLRVAVLISGRGSNLQALIASCADPVFPAEIVTVISNRPEAPGLGFAAAAGIPCAVITDGDRRNFAAQVDSLLRERGVQLICLAGFMRLLEASFCRGLARPDHQYSSVSSAVISWLKAQRQALAAGVRFAGCTVHFVRPEVDCGPIIGQAVVPIHPGDDEARLAERILQMEHRLYPLAVRLIAEERVRVIDERVEIIGWQAPRLTLVNPQDPAGEPFASHHR